MVGIAGQTAETTRGSGSRGSWMARVFSSGQMARSMMANSVRTRSMDWDCSAGSSKARSIWASGTMTTLTRRGSFSRTEWRRRESGITGSLFAGWNELDPSANRVRHRWNHWAQAQRGDPPPPVMKFCCLNWAARPEQVCECLNLQKNFLSSLYMPTTSIKCLLLCVNRGVFVSRSTSSNFYLEPSSKRSREPWK